MLRFSEESARSRPRRAHVPGGYGAEVACGGGREGSCARECVCRVWGVQGLRVRAEAWRGAGEAGARYQGARGT